MTVTKEDAKAKIKELEKISDMETEFGRMWFYFESAKIPRCLPLPVIWEISKELKRYKLLPKWFTNYLDTGKTTGKSILKLAQWEYYWAQRSKDI